MLKKTWLLGITALAIAFLGGPRAADHVDGPQAAADPAADITDVFAWMSSDTSHVILAMGIGRNVATSFKFSDRIHYVFHTSSQASFGASAKTDVDVICQFTVSQTIQCWAGNDEYVTGNASNTAGIMSASGKLRVFAGVRNDPFFFNLTGFKATATAVGAAAGGLTFDVAGCPDLTLAPGTAAFLVNQLKTGTSGAAPVNNFNGFNIGAIVVSVDKSVLAKGGPILSVWGATHRR
jgi:hypothetical protein